FRQRDGQWFGEVWEQLGQPEGAHLRRLHYQLVSQTEPRPMPGGATYENTEACWQYLNAASRNARYLGLVSPSMLEDHRSTEPSLFAEWRVAPTPAWGLATLDVDPDDGWSLPAIEADLDFQTSFWVPRLDVDGYDYHRADQPYHLEVWIEKSTMNDVLEPLCR